MGQGSLIGYLGGADFSKCGTYRYRLWRRWDTTVAPVVWIMLNPSVAGADKDDPTIKRCVKFARRWGAGGIVVVNLFGLVSTDPKELRVHPDPVGDGNDVYLRSECLAGGRVIAAWGNDGWIGGRDEIVRHMLRDAGVRLHHLGLTGQDRPKHPLARGKHRIPDTMEPIAWS